MVGITLSTIYSPAPSQIFKPNVKPKNSVDPNPLSWLLKQTHFALRTRTVRVQKLPLVQYYAKAIRPPGLICHVTPGPAGGDTWWPSRVQGRRCTCGLESVNDPNLPITAPEARILLIPKPSLNRPRANPTNYYTSLTMQVPSNLRATYFAAFPTDLT